MDMDTRVVVCTFFSDFDVYLMLVICTYVVYI
jgi:hypothetical protein